MPRSRFFPARRIAYNHLNLLENLIIFLTFSITANN